MDSLVSPWPEFDLEDPDDGPVVGRLDAGAAVVFDHLDLCGVPALEQDSVLWTETQKTSDPLLTVTCPARGGLTVYDGVLCLEVVSY